MKKAFSAVIATTAMAFTCAAHASGWPVFDAANFIKNTMTAAQALKTEVYENTNIAYQYKMMANQLQQAVGLDSTSMADQAAGIRDDIKRTEAYGQSLKDLYGGLTQNAQFLSNVQSLVTSSGKTPEQWFKDQRTLLDTGDQSAKRLFSLGQDVADNNDKLMKRRQKLQEDLNMNQTQQATAQLTNQMLDVMTSQNSDLLKLLGAKSQADAVKEQQSVADASEKAAGSQQLSRQQDAELQQLRQTVFNRGTFQGK